MNTSPVFGGSLGYVVAPPNLVAIDLSMHAAAWTANGSYAGTPAVSNGVVYGTSAGSLVARDAATGNLLWTFVGDQNLSYPPVVANGYVYVSSPNNVYAVKIATHAQAWTAAAGGWVTVAAGRLLVAGTDGTLRGYVLTTP
jgi:outer membrane protein assembly factor BamB